jgi:hypothetical protein
MIAGMITGSALFGYCVAHFQRAQVPTSLASLWEQGLGETHAYSLLGGPLVANKRLNDAARVGHVIFANSFQVMVSFLYLFYNNIITCQVVADEMIRFMEVKKALRVSTPRNLIQRSSYFLSLPFKYSVPQMVAFILLHWLVSQSVFTVQTSVYGAGPDGQRSNSMDASRVGFSSIGILFSTCVGGMLIMALIGNSFRRYGHVVPKSFPRMATNSAGIWANCHRPLLDEDAHLYPLRLGAVTPDVQSGGLRRVTFSSDTGLRPPKGGELCEFAHWPAKSGSPVDSTASLSSQAITHGSVEAAWRCDSRSTH